MQLTHTGPPQAASRRCQVLAASPGTAGGHVLPMPCLHLYLLPCRQGMSPGPTNNNVLSNVKQKRQQQATTAAKSWVLAVVPFLSCQNWMRLKCPRPPGPEQCRPKKPHNSCMGTSLSVLSPHHILPVTHGASLPPTTKLSTQAAQICPGPVHFMPTPLHGEAPTVCKSEFAQHSSDEIHTH